MAEINLLPKNKKQKINFTLINENKKIIIPSFLVSISFIIFLAGGINLFSTDFTNNKYVDLNKIEQIEELSIEKERIEGELLELKSEIFVLSEVLNNNLRRSMLLSGINDIIPPDVWLEQMLIEENKSMIMIGYSNSLSDVGVFIKKMSTLPYFTSVRLKSASEMLMYDVLFLKFEIIAALVNTEELSNE